MEFFHCSVVALDVGLEHGFSEVGAGGGHLGVAASMVKMPEAAVDEDDDLAAKHHDVRRDWQIAPMQPEWVAGGEQPSANRNLWL